MMQQPDKTGMIVTCAVITVSDTPRNDRSGQLIKQLLLDAGAVGAYTMSKMNLHKSKRRCN